MEFSIQRSAFACRYSDWNDYAWEEYNNYYVLFSGTINPSNVLYSYYHLALSFSLKSPGSELAKVLLDRWGNVSQSENQIMLGIKAGILGEPCIMEISKPLRICEEIKRGLEVGHPRPIDLIQLIGQYGLIQILQNDQSNSELLEQIVNLYLHRSTLKSGIHNVGSNTLNQPDLLSSLPEELGLQILFFLSVEDLFKMRQLSTYWKRLSQDPHLMEKIYVSLLTDSSLQDVNELKKQVDEMGISFSTFLKAHLLLIKKFPRIFSQDFNVNS
jgi:hypothetical protein